MLAAVAIGSVNKTVPLPRAGVHRIVLLTSAKEALDERKREKKVKKRLHFHFLYVHKLRIKSYVKDYIVKLLLHFKLTLKLVFKVLKWQ